MGSPHFSAWHLSQKAVAGTSRAAPNKSAAHGSPCGTERVRRIPGVMMSSSLIQVSDPLYSMIHAHTNRDFQGIHGVNDQVVREAVEGCCDVTIHHEFRVFRHIGGVYTIIGAFCQETQARAVLSRAIHSPFLGISRCQASDVLLSISGGSWHQSLCTMVLYKPILHVLEGWGETKIGGLTN